ncbi:rubredoxin [Legionella nautarum]|uniref:Rubredoxin n=2 Tax=Legionella nautarum TaxID=45070 RepID=A0A0W0WWF8_9GAMM|nr:rubredoxin [Legionella nautarum]
MRLSFTIRHAIAKLAPLNLEQKQMQEYKKYICVICGFIYDEAEGWPEDGIEPGTRWEDVPENWFCPDCGAGKEDFEMIEIE